MIDPFAKKVEKKAVDDVSVPERNTIPEENTVPENREPSPSEIENYVERRKAEEAKLRDEEGEAVKKVPYFKPVKETIESVDDLEKREEPVEEYNKLVKEQKQMDREETKKQKVENKELLKNYKEREHEKKIRFKQQRKEEKVKAKEPSSGLKAVDKDKIKDVIVEKRGIDWNRATMYLSVLGIMGIIFFNQMVGEVSSGLAILLWLFGMMCFLPLGFILGWMLLDPYVRCKIMRRIRHKNYGMIHFVHKGGKRIDTRIKNLDDDVIVHDTKLWLINNEGVYYIDVDGKKVKQAEINSENIATLPSNVPALFLDSETMIPLTFHKTASVTNPQVAGATILGYVNNQIAKNLFFKKQMTMFYMIIIAISAITLVVVLGIYSEMEELKEIIPALQNEVSNLNAVINNMNNPLPP